MRIALERVKDSNEHVALAYDAWAPIGAGGKVPDTKREGWLTQIAKTTIACDYHQAFARWQASFVAPDARSFTVKLASRLLVGHGNPSATGVGLTVHHTWGTPIIPGSALKGLCAHYVDAIYGPANFDLPPWDRPAEDHAREPYRGVTWNERRSAAKYGPGEVYRALFGAPDAERDAEAREHHLAAGASPGLVTFHDALYVPSGTNDAPYAADVLTPHQMKYHAPVSRWPSDYDDPNPVAFLTVRPGVRMFFALSGLPEWTLLAERLLRSALSDWGVGGKTTSGYGRTVPRPSTAAHAALKRGDAVTGVLVEEKTKKNGWQARIAHTDIVGSIDNSASVPPDKRPGDAISLVVAVVPAGANKPQFRVVVAADPADPATPPGADTKRGSAAIHSNKRKAR